MSDPSPPGGDRGGLVTHRCYRHPDRVAGVSCQRCDQPICPSCMITASVGFQCPSCAKGGSGATQFRRMLPENANPTVTYGLMAVNAAVFLLGMARGSSLATSGNALAEDYALWTAAVANGEWWRLVTSGFIHYGIIHLAFNMYVLYVVGGALERMIGRLQFAIIYFVSLLGGSFLVVLISASNAATAGASGAVFGLFGAFAVQQLSRGVNPMQSGIGATILLNLVLTFAIPGISIGGHLGGLLAGGLCGAILFGVNPDHARQRRAQLGVSLPALVVVGAVLAAGAVLVARSKVGL